MASVQPVLRWILFLPGAFLAAYLIWLIIVFAFSRGDPDWILSKVFIEVVGHGAMGVAFVYAGSRIAPGYRKIVAYLLTTLAILFAGFSLFPAVAAHNWWAVVGGICLATGAALVAYSVAEGELDLDTHRLP
jgi:hypothetical protein